ncbi:MAG TPA: ribonuclease PH [Terriglobia bacterium]|nr:ribonuclease PH [Terriglobia bacterium]HVB28568.1 ribonuclease PH [Terriglobia bacterium]
MVRAEHREASAIRPVEIIPDFISSAEGSALIRLGQTQVICTASVDTGVPAFLKGTGKGWVSSEYAMIPRATETRTPREVTRGRPSGRTMEIQRLIGRSLRAIINLEKLGERTVWIDCDVIRADGGTRTASITGAMVAMALALKKLKEHKVIQAIPLNDYVAAISVGIIGNETLLDLDYSEDSSAEVDMNVVMTGSGRFVEVQATAEGLPFSSEDLAKLIELTRPAIQQLIEIQKSITKIDLPIART